VVFAAGKISEKACYKCGVAQENKNTSSGLRPPSPQRGEGKRSNIIFRKLLRADAGLVASLVVGCGRRFSRSNNFQKTVLRFAAAQRTKMEFSKVAMKNKNISPVLRRKLVPVGRRRPRESADVDVRVFCMFRGSPHLHPCQFVQFVSTTLRPLRSLRLYQSVSIGVHPRDFNASNNFDVKICGLVSGKRHLLSGRCRQSEKRARREI
jgi:hypothetical protein